MKVVSQPAKTHETSSLNNHIPKKEKFDPIVLFIVGALSYTAYTLSESYEKSKSQSQSYEVLKTGGVVFSMFMACMLYAHARVIKREIDRRFFA